MHDSPVRRRIAFREQILTTFRTLLYAQVRLMKAHASGIILDGSGSDALLEYRGASLECIASRNWHLHPIPYFTRVFTGYKLCDGVRELDVC